MVRAIQAAGSSYKVARREDLSNAAEPVGDARPGGLYLAYKSCEDEQRTIIRSVTQEPGTGP